MDEDDVIAITNFLLRGDYPEGFNRDDKRSLRQKSNAFVCEADEAGVHILYHRGRQDKRQLVIYDPVEKQEIIRTAHADVSGLNSGRLLTTAEGVAHNGINTTLRKISERYWWRGLVEDVRSFCKNCAGCSHANTALHLITPVNDVSEDAGGEKIADLSTEESSSGPLLTVSKMASTVLTSETYSDSLLAALSELRSQNLFCDVTLMSDDGTFQTKVHKVVLVAASDYLKSLLLDPDLIINDHITVPNVSGGCLENLVSFMYSGVLHLTRDTVNSVMLVATQMEMSTAVELCQNFIANPPCSASPPCSADPPCSVDPPCSDPFGEKENSDCNSKDVTEDDEVDEVVYTKELPVNLKKEKTIDTRSPISLRKRVRVGSRSSPSRMARSSPSTMTSTYNKCGWCGQKFTARSMLVEHRNNVHRKRTDATLVPVCRRVIRDWTCSEKDCAMQFKHKDKLCQHMAEHHPTVIFSCPECRFKTQVEHILKRHIYIRHRERHSCEICGKAYHKPFLLRVHMYNRHKVKDPSLKLYRCSQEGCGYACPSKNGMSLHMLKHAQPDAFACEVCGKTFKRLAGLDKHMSKIHLGIRPYICDKCGISYSDEPELRMHIARHAEKKPHCCNLCSYSTFQKGSLKSHLFCRHQVLMDSEMPVLRCDYCSFMTDKRCRFDDHIKMHHNIRDIPCNECGKLFVTKKTLRQHIIKVHRRTAATTTSASPTTAPAAVTSCAFVIPTQVQKLNDELQSTDDDVPAAETNIASQELFTTTDVINNLHTSSFQSATAADYDQLTVQSAVTPVEYQMLMSLPTSDVPVAGDSTASLTQVAAVSGAGPIIVGISLPTIDNVATYQTFQPFDLQHARIVL